MWRLPKDGERVHLVALDLAAVRRGQSQRASVLSDYWALTKPEVNFLIALATLAAFWTGSPKPLADFPWLLGLYTLLGTVFVASGAGTLMSASTASVICVTVNRV
jgi:heme O synthase-like polyprenyltransferase